MENLYIMSLNVAVFKYICMETNDNFCAKLQHFDVQNLF